MCYNNTKYCADKVENANTSDRSIIKDISNTVVVGFKERKNDTMAASDKGWLHVDGNEDRLFLWLHVYFHTRRVCKLIHCNKPHLIQMDVY